MRNPIYGPKVINRRVYYLLVKHVELPGDCQLLPAYLVLQQFALFPAHLARLLRVAVAQGKCRQADGGKGEGGAPLAQVGRLGDDREGRLELLLDVGLGQALADVDVLATHVLGAGVPQVRLTVAPPAVGLQ